jgi:D-3-phosphoglycerate dehydrogenase
VAGRRPGAPGHPWCGTFYRILLVERSQKPQAGQHPAWRFAVASYRVVLTDQVFPDVELERELLAGIDAELVVASGDRDRVIAEAAAADALLNTYFPIGAADIARLERCRVIARYGIGVDNIDVAAAREAGIVVTNVPDYSIEEVAVHTLALILAWVRRIPGGLEKARSETWTLAGLRPIRRLSEETVGVVGLGRIGRTVARLLAPTGARLLGFDPFPGPPIEGVERVERLEDLLAASDIVTLHAPVTAETRGMIGSAQLACMRPDALLVNTSRGGLVRTADLVEALREGRIGGAAVDVLEREAADVPAFEGLSNVLITPHMAYYSESSLRESQRKATTQVIRVLTGQAPDYPVT